MLHAETYFAVNAALNTACLLLGGRLAGLDAPGAKAVLAWGALGGGGALAACALPALTFPALALLPLGVWGCYRSRGPAACLRACVMTLAAALLLGGAAQWMAGLGAGAKAAALGAGALCAALCPLLRLLPAALVEVRQIELGVQKRSVLLPAMLDSGNLLTDPITGCPVIVVSARALRPLFPGALSLSEPDRLPPGFRLMNVRTAAGSALMPIFRPDVCRLYVDGRAADASALVAVAPGAYRGVQALVPLAALPRAAAFKGGLTDAL
ncbi:MAG: sigma-E processing peptidase SpoIIGA [Eubacteriales bacterium]|nr:sigma-E processing peptidase SpoIIGA [Eubacteriales bacterium]